MSLLLLLSSHTHKKVDAMHGMQEIVTFPAKTTSHIDIKTPKSREIDAKKQINVCNCLWLFNPILPGGGGAPCHIFA